MFIRYIRDHLNGSNWNDFSHWVEIQAFSDGVNVALGKPVTSDSPGKGQPTSIITEGRHDNPDLNFESVDNNNWVHVDLQNVYDVTEIKVWHFFNISKDRIYRETKTEVSEDGTNWTTIFDSDVDGTYYEIPEGHSITLESIPDPGFVEGNVLLTLDQELVRTDVLSLNLDQELVRTDVLSLNLDQELIRSDVLSLNLDQELIRTDVLSLNLDQTLSKSDQITLDLNQELSRLDQVLLDFDQELSKSDQISLDFDQEIVRFDSISLNLTQKLGELEFVSLDFDQIISKSDQVSLDLTQELSIDGVSYCSLIENIYEDSHQFIEIQPSIYETDSILLNLEQQQFESQAESLWLQQSINQDKEIPLNLNQNIIFGENRIASLYLDQDIYLTGQSVLDLEQQSSLDDQTILSIFIEYVMPIIGRVDLPIDIHFVDYASITPTIGRIHLKGKREPYSYLKGNVERILYVKGGIALTYTNEDFSMFSGDTKVLIVTMDEPIDLEGAEIKWGIRKNRKSSESLFVKTLSNGITIQNEEISVKLDPIDTQALSGDYFHEMELTDIFNNVSTVFVGKVHIEQSGI